jgi:prepilin-type N-terminal cleavage/methylation domain-containing protein
MRRKEIGYLPQRHRRGAFTLIELLVVIAIIAALVALSASAVIKFLGSQQQANTQSTLDRTQAKLNVAWAKVKDQAFKETIDPSVDAWIRTNITGTGDANSTGRVRAVYVKLRLRQVFPMNFNEALNKPIPFGVSTIQSPLQPLPAYVTYLSKVGISGSLALAATDNFESSACLLMALQRGQSGAGFDLADLTSGGSAGSYMNGTSSIPYLADAWGKPLHFARFPTGSTILNPAGALPGNNDPGDPQGYLNDTNWPKLQPTGQQAFSLLTLQSLAKSSNPPLSYKLAPLLCSSGIDKTLQADPTNFTPGTGSDDQFSTPQ